MNGWEARLERERSLNSRWGSMRQAREIHAALLAEARALGDKPNRTDKEQRRLEALARRLTGLDGGLPSSSRINPGRARHYSIVPGGLPGHGKR